MPYNPLYTASYHFMSNQPSKENAVAYCHNKRHIGRLSRKTMKNHQCLQKQCPFLEKLEHPYWEIKKRKKELAEMNR